MAERSHELSGRKRTVSRRAFLKAGGVAGSPPPPARSTSTSPGPSREPSRSASSGRSPGSARISARRRRGRSSAFGRPSRTG